MESKSIDDSKEPILIQGINICVDPNAKPIFSAKTENYGEQHQCDELINLLEENPQSFLYSNTKSKIVIVDDQYSSRMSVMLHIEDMGLQDRVVLLQNGKEAVEYFKEKLDQLRL